MYLSYVLIFIEILLLFMSFKNYKNSNNLKRIDFIILFFIFTIISGFRYNVGKDFATYEQMYNNPYNISNLFLEPIWRLISSSLHLLGFSSVYWFLFTSLLINFFFIKGVEKKSKDFYLSMAFYMSVPQMFCETFNAVRQFVAVSIVFYFFYLFLEKKKLKFFLVTIIASVFHTSALFIFPIFLISKIKIPNSILLFIVCFSFIMRNHFGKFIALIVSNISAYSAYAETLIIPTSNSGAYAYVILFVCITIIVRFWNSSNYEIKILENLTLLSFSIYLISYTFQPVMRMSFYFIPYLLLLVPYIKKKNAEYSFIVIGGLFCLFMLFTVKAGFSQMYNVRF